MKTKFIAPVVATLLMGSTLSANHLFFSDPDVDKFYLDFHKQFEQFFDRHRDVNFHTSSVFSNYPKMDMIEDKNSYTLKFALAGMKKEDIKVTLNEEKILTISGKQNKYTKEQKDGMLRQEQYIGSFSRSIALAKDSDTKNIKVNYKNGVLSIVVAKDMKKVEKKGVKILQIN